MFCTGTSSRADTIIRTVDRQALLTACRAMLSQREVYAAEYSVEDSTRQIVIDLRHNPDMKDVVPQEIVALEPIRIVIGQKYVEIVITGGMSYLSIIGYAEGVRPVGKAEGEGVTKLTDGLWLMQR